MHEVGEGRENDANEAHHFKDARLWMLAHIGRVDGTLLTYEEQIVAVEDVANCKKSVAQELSF